uniref:Uncharacterized protein n=1 Tax=uncultured marine thaumarchaeote KM3_54_G11 TaxID=1456193 RepID=A0A075HAI1_9ARCH|nr:hypothetical protein [uncultured marine thaumarchaeote KM3_54_G11]
MLNHYFGLFSCIEYVNFEYKQYEQFIFDSFFEKILGKHTKFYMVFIGIILLILGSFVTIFDYPQIQYFENMDSEMYATLESEQKEIHNRLIIEFSVGLVILLAGGASFIMSFFKNSKK